MGGKAARELEVWPGTHTPSARARGAPQPRRPNVCRQSVGACDRPHNLADALRVRPQPCPAFSATSAPGRSIPLLSTPQPPSRAIEPPISARRRPHHPQLLSPPAPPNPSQWLRPWNRSSTTSRAPSRGSRPACRISRPRLRASPPALRLPRPCA